MNRKAFTLMELLLVVSIVAIVAAASAPMFSSGSEDAVREAKRASFLRAYQNTISGANLMMGLLLTNYTQSKKGQSNASYARAGFLTPGLSLDALNQWKVGNKGECVNLNYYSPILSRMFKDLNGHQYFFSAKFGDNQDLLIYYVDVSNNNRPDQTPDLNFYHGAAFDAAPNATVENGKVIELKGNKDLEYYWKKINNI